MDLLNRFRRVVSASNETANEMLGEPIVRRAPGLATLLEGIALDGSHAVLDLGPAADSSLRVYGRFARWVRFADLPASASPPDWVSALDALTRPPERPYDLLFAWDIPSRLGPVGRASLVRRLADLSAPDARLHMVIEASERVGRRPVRFMIDDLGRMRYELIGPARPAPSHLLPAEVERVLAPFQVERAFTLSDGLREYVARKAD